MNNDSIPTESAFPKPTYQVTLEIEEEYMLVRAVGLRRREAVSSLVTEIASAAIEHQRAKILIDVRKLEGWLRVFDSYFIVTEDFQRIRGKGIEKVAIVDRPLPEFREWFFEIVVRNRGFNLRMFQSPTEALNWLLGP